MRKSALAVLLVVTLLFCSCGNSLGERGEVTSDIEGTLTEEALSDSLSGEKEMGTNEETMEFSEPDTGYLAIDRVEPKDYVTKCFAAEGSEFGLSLRLSEDWAFEKQSKTIYDIYTNGRQVGRVIFDSDGKDDDWKELSEEFVASGDVDIEICIEKSVSSGAYRQRLCFTFLENGEKQKIALEVDYQELSETAIDRIKQYTQYKRVGSDPRLGMIVMEESNYDKVLILGNSFIGTSQVGSILQEMTYRNGKDTLVQHISRGYAHVDTYAYDDIIMDNIKGGMYRAVFICGFYSNDQAEHLSVLKKACDESRTALVMFPAHNEPASSIKYVQKMVKGVYLLNWKEEVQAFIDGGGNKWDFCYDDQHLHSTPLAGYIGAHMIYRAIYGEIPQGSVNQIVLQSEVDRILGNYSETGIIYSVKSDNLYFFDK